MSQKLNVFWNAFWPRGLKGTLTFAFVYLILFVCINDVATDEQLMWVAAGSLVVGVIVALINPTFEYYGTRF